MISSAQLARQLAVYSVITKTKNVGSIAQMTGLSGLIVTNAVFEGERLGLFTVKRDKKQTIEKIEVTDEQYADIAMVKGNFGDAVDNLVNEIVAFVRNRNGVERDVEEYSLQLLSRSPEVMFSVAIAVVKELPEIHWYDYADPQDPESVYTFLTLSGNEKNKWYRHNFKTTNKKK